MSKENVWDGVPYTLPNTYRLKQEIGVVSYYYIADNSKFLYHLLTKQNLHLCFDHRLTGLITGELFVSKHDWDIVAQLALFDTNSLAAFKSFVEVAKKILFVNSEWKLMKYMHLVLT